MFQYALDEVFSRDRVNFQVIRRTHSSFMGDLKVRPKVVADQLGHSVDVNQNVYTRSGFEIRKEAVNSLELALNDAQVTHNEINVL